jgi:AraC-like DNA-binding protein
MEVSKLERLRPPDIVVPEKQPIVLFAGRYYGSHPVEEHTHPCSELILVTNGKCRIRAPHTWSEGTAGSLFLMPAQVVQYQEELDYVETTFVGFESPTPFTRMIRIDLEADRAPARWMEDICDLHLANEHPNILNTLLWTLLASLAQRQTRQQDSEALHPDLLQAVRFLEGNFTTQVTVPQVASQVHLSTSRLSELFRDRYGCGPLAYVHTLRMQRAERLLLDPHASVRDVGDACGYGDTNYFIRMFKKRHGIAPDKWRKRTRESQGSEISIRWL